MQLPFNLPVTIQLVVIPAQQTPNPHAVQLAVNSNTLNNALIRGVGVITNGNVASRSNFGNSAHAQIYNNNFAHANIAAVARTPNNMQTMMGFNMRSLRNHTHHHRNCNAHMHRQCQPSNALLMPQVTVDQSLLNVSAPCRSTAIPALFTLNSNSNRNQNENANANAVITSITDIEPRAHTNSNTNKVSPCSAGRPRARPLPAVTYTSSSMQVPQPMMPALQQDNENNAGAALSDLSAVPSSTSTASIPATTTSAVNNGNTAAPQPQEQQQQRMRATKKPKRFQCDICLKWFTRKSNMKQHKKTHSSVHEFVCSYCHRGFHQKHSLRDHQRIHTGEKPFKCDWCDRGFRVKHNLATHARLHIVLLLAIVSMRPSQKTDLEESLLLNGSDDHADGDNEKSPVHNAEDAHKNKLGTLNGCYVPCLLNIMGIILFERLGWGVGQVGVRNVLIIFAIAETQSIITVLSLCAIVTNGTMRAGGSYYMISRTLGPEFGGSIGLLFYAAYCVGVAFYASGFAEEVVFTWFPDSPYEYWLINGFSSAVLLLCLVIALIGAECFTRINVLLFIWQFLAIFISLLACFFRSTFDLEGQTSPCTEEGIANGDFKHYGWTWDRFTDTWNYPCSVCLPFAAVFGVLFPAATGIMEGANLSGDLKDPSYSIPVGTLSAVGTSIVFYFLLIVAFAGSFNQCTLRKDTTIMQEAAWGAFGTYTVVSGIIISASSSALGSLFGGARVLQAIARDKLFPYTKIFEYGSKKGDEPRVAVVFTWLIAQALVFVGGLDTIAPISTAFFCLSYATVNFSCFLLAISGTPNFRPSFKYYSWPVCLIGTLSNVAVMFYVDWRFGLIASIVEMFIFGFLLWREPQNDWGDVTQSIMFHQVRKYLLRLDPRKTHVKSWRPSILLLADSKSTALIDFCNNLKKGGLYIIGVAIDGDFGEFDRTTKLTETWVDFIDSNKLKAFPQINVAPNLRHGLENLILLSGLGALQANTVVLPLIRIRNELPHKSKLTQHRNVHQNANEDTLEEEEETEAKSESPVNHEDAEEEEHDEDTKQKQDAEEEEKKELDHHSLSIQQSGNADDASTDYTRSFTTDSEIITDYHHLDVPSSKTMQAMVPQTPADLDVNEYTKLCRNILKYRRNVVITANFHTLDSQLIVSDAIQRVLAQPKNSFFEMEPVNASMDSSQKTHKGQNFSVQEEAFLQKTVTHDYMHNAAVPKSREEAQWIDVWLFANDYTFQSHDVGNNNKDDVFPMLIMQLAHVLLRNKVWSKKANAKLRVLLMVGNKWGQEDKHRFEELLQYLRLKRTIDHLQILKQPENYSKPSWQQIVDGKRKGSSLKKYYNSLNSTIKTLSSETYFVFMKLPQFPPTIEDDEEMNAKLNKLYYQSLYVLLRGMPPTALVETGETNPVISTDL